MKYIFYLFLEKINIEILILILNHKYLYFFDFIINYKIN